MKNKFNIDEYIKIIRDKISGFATKKQPADFSQEFSGGEPQLAGKESIEKTSDSGKTQIKDQKQPITERGKASQAPEVKDSRKEAFGVLGTNLIKGEIVSFFDWRKGITIMLYFLGLGILVVGLTYGSLFIWESYKKEQSKRITASAQELKQNILIIQNDLRDVTQLQNKLKLVKKLLDKHIYWTNIFNFLEDNTLAEVTYNNFYGSLGGEFNLPAKAKNFYVIAEQIKELRKNEYVIDTSTTGGNLVSGEDGEGSHIEFSLELSISEDLFYNYKN